MIIAYHLVWTTYGTWLPNDPRGSGSRYVAASALGELGELHYGRKQAQPHPREVRNFYDDAEKLLQFTTIRLDAAQIERVGIAFSESLREYGYTCYACAILSDHLHLVLRKHRDSAEKMIENLQQATRARLRSEQVIRDGHPLWTLGGWRGFLDSPERVWTAIRYVERNPNKAGLTPQRWDFVRSYDGWPFR